MDQRKWARLALLASSCVFLMAAVSGCGSQAGTQASSSSQTDTGSQSTAGSQSTTGSQSTAGSQTTPSANEENLYTPKYVLNGKEVVVIKTTKGTITAKLYEKDAPIASANFVELALKGFYNGIKFHRYVAGFVVQAGDPGTKAASAAAVAAADANQTNEFGAGGPGYSIKDEFASNPNKHVDGTLAMARTQAPNSGGSQFYFSLAVWPGGDNQYTVFGQATSGLDVIHKLRAGDEIKSITVENASK